MTAQHIATKRFEDSRGWFIETWQRSRYEQFGIVENFCQDNHSLSVISGTIRGLHFQRAPHAQAKLVRCLRGAVYDVAVDIRSDSPTFRQWVGVVLSAERGNQLYIPSGYAHGFLTLEDNTEIAYKVDANYAPEADGGISWLDPNIGVEWPLDNGPPKVSAKDECLPLLREAEFFFPYDGKPLLPLQE